MCRWGQYAKVNSKYTKDWQVVADHWAFYNRADLWGMDVNTNNHLERWIGIFKYMFLHGKKLAQLAQLINLLLTDVFPHYEKDRLKKIIGVEQSSKWLLGLSVEAGVQHQFISVRSTAQVAT